MALWISITRVNDYKHHVEDVFMGSILGAICGFIMNDETFVSFNSVPDVGVILHNTNAPHMGNNDIK